MKFITISNIIEEVKKTIPAEKLGIHAHNDTENGVANALAAINTGVRHVQGTENGMMFQLICCG